MKTDIKGTSTCPRGQETFEDFLHNGKRFFQYDYRHENGSLFSIVNDDLDTCRALRDEWLCKNHGPYPFLDYEIKWTSADGYVITKSGLNLWETHLGNFGNLDNAKKHCVLNFMVARPETFHGNVVSRMAPGSLTRGLYLEWYTFKEAVEKAELDMPPELGPSDDINQTIYFNNEPI